MKKVIKKKKSILFVYLILPIITIWIAYLLINKMYLSHIGHKIILQTDNVNSFELKKTKVKYHGIIVGKVADIKIDDNNLHHFLVTIQMDKKYDYLTREHTIFYKISPVVSINKVANLGTIITGSYIEILPPSYSKEQLLKLPLKTKFKLLDKKPIEGKVITLTNNNGDLSKGSIIVYKGVEIGRILDKNLINNKIKYQTLIYPKYQYLLTHNPTFIKINKIKFEASLNKIKLQIPSLKNLISGGIEVKIDNNKPKIKSNYELYNNEDELIYNQTPFTFITKSTNSFDYIYFHNIKVAKIINSKFDINNQILKVVFKKKYLNLLHKSPIFYIKKPIINLSHIKNIIKSEKIMMQINNKESNLKSKYIIASNPPYKNGYVFYLKGANDFVKGDKIYYKGIVVGEIIDVYLKNNKLITKAKIYNKYKYLVNNSTLFYKLNPIELKANFDEVKVNISPIKDFINGGVSFITLKNTKLSNKHFKLFDSKTNLQTYLLHHTKGEFINIYTKNLDSIKKGSIIVYKGMKIGEILDYKYIPNQNIIKLITYINKNYTNLINDKTKFYKNSAIKIKANLEGIDIKTEPLSTIAVGSLELKTSKLNHTNKKDFYISSTLENYFDINITTNKLYGITKASKLFYKNFEIGKVKNIILNNNFIVTLQINKKYKKYFGKDSKIYLQNFKPTNLKTIKNILGANLYLIADNNGFKHNYKLDSISPADTKYLQGLRINLKADSKASIDVGTPIYFKYVKIGEVENIQLSSDATFVKVRVFINPKYKHLIRTNSKFYNMSIMGFKVSLFSAKLKMGTLPTLIKGGIGIVTPNDAGKIVDENYTFKLYDEPKDNWKKYNPKL